MAVAGRQACYDGALGARGIQSLQLYEKSEPLYVLKANFYIFVFLEILFWLTLKNLVFERVLLRDREKNEKKRG